MNLTDLFIGFMLGLWVSVAHWLVMFLRLRKKAAALRAENERLVKENADLRQRNLLLCDSLIRAHEELRKWERVPGVVEDAVLNPREKHPVIVERIMLRRRD
jgi:hypothetical protein